MVRMRIIVRVRERIEREAGYDKGNRKAGRQGNEDEEDSKGKNEYI